jgi:phosphatidylglycerol:prolipoprotein diacylglycerol transferase
MLCGAPLAFARCHTAARCRRPRADAAAGIGRIGCQISGDGDWGIAANMALKPDWLPSWLWAQTYDNNIYGELIAAPGVYPTPIYETAMALLCFALLWPCGAIHSRIGWLFSLYLLLAGAERLLIEQIRVNLPSSTRQPARHVSRIRSPADRDRA